MIWGAPEGLYWASGGKMGFFGVTCYIQGDAGVSRAFRKLRERSREVPRGCLGLGFFHTVWVDLGFTVYTGFRANVRSKKSGEGI